MVFVLGASIGSFLNVVAHRLPLKLSLWHPPSRCPQCLRSLKPYDNIPVLGWLKLKGRCRYCRTPISLRYPIVEGMTGLVFVWIAWSFPTPLLAIGYWALFSWLLALSLIDLDTMTLPLSLMRSGLVVGLLFQTLGGWLNHQTVVGAAAQLFSGILGAVVGIWLFDLIRIGGSIALKQDAMGSGDAKLAAMMGAWLGWKLLLLAGFLACVGGAAIGGGAMALGWLDRRQPMPFGPFLALGAMLALFFGEPLLLTYRQLFFPTL
ncbi:MAG: prepilin peptidase [Leptolyngbyaceae cyanobacterium SL_7_1]|nr:prepilin peptidase [Leptolyngbyaceae cyanobacterium SL_7_1]